MDPLIGIETDALNAARSINQPVPYVLMRKI